MERQRGSHGPPRYAPQSAHDRHRHTVAERLITRTIGGRLAAIVNQGVIVGEPLQALTLARGQPPHGHLPHHPVEQLAALEALRLPCTGLSRSSPR